MGNRKLTKTQADLLSAIREESGNHDGYFSYSFLMERGLISKAPLQSTVKALVRKGYISARFIYTTVSFCKVYNFGRKEHWCEGVDLDIRLSLDSSGGLELWFDRVKSGKVERGENIGSKKYYIYKQIK